MLLLPLRVGKKKKSDTSRHAHCQPLDRFIDELSNFTRVAATVLLGPWVTEKKSCPRGYVCILERRWNSIGNVLSAVMLSFIYTLSSFDFWDFAAVSLLVTSLLYWETLCKRISNFIVEKEKKRYHIFTVFVEYIQQQMTTKEEKCWIQYTSMGLSRCNKRKPTLKHSRFIGYKTCFKLRILKWKK